MRVVKRGADGTRAAVENPRRLLDRQPEADPEDEHLSRAVGKVRHGAMKRRPRSAEIAASSGAVAGA